MSFEFPTDFGFGPKPTDKEIQQFRALLDQITASLRQQSQKVSIMTGRIQGLFEAAGSDEARVRGIKATFDAPDLGVIMNALLFVNMMALAKQYGIET